LVDTAMLSRDGIAALVVLAGSLVLFALTLGLADNPLVPIGPGFYPRLVLGVTALLALALLVKDVGSAKRSREPQNESSQRVNHALVVALFAAFWAYALALPFIGFRIATFAFVVLAQALLDPPRERSRWMRLLVIAVATTAITYYLFEHYLHVLLPRGRWTGL
jgi:hypothetical protein